MRFPYPDIDTVTYDDKRWYDTPHGYYPSITTILGFTETEAKRASLQRWKDALGAEADIISKAAIERGVNVHLLCERFLKGEPLRQGDNIPVEDIQSFTALKTKLKNVSEVWGQEVALFSREIEIAGRCDLIGVYKGIPCIVDYKTARRTKGHEDVGDYKVQLAFYGMAHNEMFKTDIEDGIILMVAETGFPLEFKVKLKDHYAELKERAAFFWQCAINKAMETRSLV